MDSDSKPWERKDRAPGEGYPGDLSDKHPINSENLAAWRFSRERYRYLSKRAKSRGVMILALIAIVLGLIWAFLPAFWSLWGLQKWLPVLLILLGVIIAGCSTVPYWSAVLAHLDRKRIKADYGVEARWCTCREGSGHHCTMLDGHDGSDELKRAVDLLPKFDDHMIDLGARVISVIAFPDRWIHWRNEALDLLEGRKARRRVVVDCTTPYIRWDHSDWFDVGATTTATLAPLALIRKQPVLALEVTDDSGLLVPTLGRRANTLLAAAAMAFIVWQAGEANKHGAGPDFVEHYWSRVAAVATSDPISAMKHANTLISELGLQEMNGMIVRSLAECFPLTLVLPRDVRGQRRVYQYSYHWEMSAAGHRMRLFFASLGWDSFQWKTELGILYFAETYHFECASPPGLIISGLELPPDITGSARRSGPSRYMAHAGGKYTYAAPAVAENAVISFDLDPGKLLPRVLGASAAVAILYGIMLTIPDLSAELTAKPVSEGVIALLLFLPALFVALNARGPENAIVGTMQLPLRLLTLGLSGSLFITGATLIINQNVNANAIRTDWLLSFIYAVLGVVSSLIGIIRLNRRISGKNVSHKHGSMTPRQPSSAMYLIPSAEGRRDSSGPHPTPSDYEKQRTSLLKAVKRRMEIGY